MYKYYIFFVFFVIFIGFSSCTKCQECEYTVSGSDPVQKVKQKKCARPEELAAIKLAFETEYINTRCKIISQ